MIYYSSKKQNSNGEIRLISLLKCDSNEGYVVIYQSGKEVDVVDALVAMASDPRTDFSWLDAAGLAHQMGKRLEEELKELYH